MIWFFNRGSTSVEGGGRGVHRVNDSVDNTPVSLNLYISDIFFRPNYDKNYDIKK